MTRTLKLLITLAVSFAALAQSPDVINTYAGGGPNNVPATSAATPYPRNTAVDSSGNLYYVVGYSARNRVYEVDTSGTLTVVAGNGSIGYSGDGGLASLAAMDNPQAVAVDSSGNVYVADFHNCIVRKVTKSTGVISTYAGTPQSCGYSGDGGAAVSGQLDYPQGIALDNSGNLYIADTLNQRIREVTASTGKITTMAGNGTYGYSGDGGPAISAEVHHPYDVAVDGSGNVYIADTSNYRIRKVTAATGIISTIAGNGTPGFSGDGGPATNAQISQARGLASDSSGNVFIADYENCVVREVSGGMINTVAGQGQICGYWGDGGPATSAALYYPYGVAVNSSDTMFIADYENNRVRKAVLGGNIGTIAGNGTYYYTGATTAAGSAFGGVQASVPDASGNVYIADTYSCLVWKATSSGAISLIAGTPASASSDYRVVCGDSGDGGLAVGAQLDGPAKAVPDSSGNVYIADAGDCVIRKVEASTGIISAFAGGRGCGYSGDGGPATNAELRHPSGLAFDGAGNLYIADTSNNVVREVSATSGIIITVAGNNAAGPGYSGDGGPPTAAQLWNPEDVAVDASGNLYIADTTNGRIRVVSGGIIDTLAGNGSAGCDANGVPAIQASLDSPYGVAVDAAGDVLIADTYDNCVRWVDGAGTIYTVAGSGTYGFAGDGGPANSAELAFPFGVGVDPAGNIYIADIGNARVRDVTAVPNLNSSTYSVAFGSQKVGSSSTKAFQLRSIGPLEIKSISIAGTGGDFTQKNDCSSKPASGASCEVDVTFAPTSKGAKTGTITIMSNGFFNPTLTIALAGTGQ